jgi:hypothetical protein
MKVVLVAFSMVGLAAASAASNSSWPSCYVTGSDYDGDDVIAGLRLHNRTWIISRTLGNSNSVLLDTNTI